MISNGQYPQRALIAYPFNPPHLVPLVELATGQSFYLEVGESILFDYSELLTWKWKAM